MRVLYAVHALPSDTVGGTELYTRRLAETVAGAGDRNEGVAGNGNGSGDAHLPAGDHEVAVATPSGHDADVAGARVYALPDPPDPTDPTGVESGLESGVVDGDVDRGFVRVLDEFDPDVVHLQHFKYLSATLPVTCARRGVPCIATLHDFWTVCHREQLLRPSGAPCSGPESVAKCAACYDDALRRSDPRDARSGIRAGSTEGETFAPGGPWERGTESPGPDGSPEGVVQSAGSPDGEFDPWSAVERRSEHLAAAREAVDLFVAPSEFLRERFVAFGTPPDRIVQRRNGIRVGAFEDTGFDPGEPLRVGYAGRIAPVKGVHVLLSAFERVEADAELHVFGRFDPDGDPYHARLRERASEQGPDRVTFHGRYGAASTPYEGVDVLVVPSLWYENSPLVIQEAFASRVPVVAGDVGGMAELVRDGEDGLTVPVGDPGALGDALQRLADSPATVERLRAGIDPPKSLGEHARELLDLYEACRDGHVRGDGGTS